MEPDSLPISVRFVLVCLLGAARLSGGGQNPCPCPEIPQWPLTKPPPEECRQINSSFRYTCVDGYVRKAGTSNRIKCELKDGAAAWERSHLECIVDPTKPKAQPPTNSTATKSPEGTLRDTPASIKTTTAASATSPPNNQRNITRDGGADGVEGTPHDLGTQTTVKTRTVGMSTLSHVSTSMEPRPPPEAQTGPVKAAVISLVSLAIVCAAVGLACVLYRRRRSENDSAAGSRVEERLPMNPPSGLQLESVHRGSS